MEVIHSSHTPPRQALAMVEDEKKRYRPTKNYLEHLPVLNLAGFEVNNSQTNILIYMQQTWVIFC